MCCVDADDDGDVADDYRFIRWCSVVECRVIQVAASECFDHDLPLYRFYSFLSFAQCLLLLVANLLFTT